MNTPYTEVLSLDQMIARLKKANPEADTQLVEKAYHFAQKAHAGQLRRNGDPYFDHPCVVAGILLEMVPEAPAIAAGLLHDVVEDCPAVTLDMVREEFGDEVAQLVDGVTKLNKLDFANREEAQAENLRKLIIAMGQNLRVIFIKLADRLHNMRTLRYQKPERQAPIAQETLDIYAPLAHRFGVNAIKSELEDLSLRYVDPAAYKEISQLVGHKWQQRVDAVAEIIRVLSEKLDEEGIHYDINGRPKHFYSIYRKLKTQQKSFDEIYDIIAIRVITDSLKDCYGVLGVVHTMWPQVEGRFKDYISNPKSNDYQSLHTTVMGGAHYPFPFEVQIRTREMHRKAEYGIAAHWQYKEGRSAQNDTDLRISSIRSVLDLRNAATDSREFFDVFKTQLMEDEVAVFTPKGEVIFLARGATPIDYAYRIHSGVGNACIGAKINGRIVPLDTPLATGNIVEILTSPNSKGPSMDWLTMCKTPQAMTKIRQFFKKENREENVKRGRDMVERECKRYNVQPHQLLLPEFYNGILKRNRFTELDDIFGAVGYGALSSTYVVARLMDERRLKEAAAPQRLEDIPKVPPRPVKQGKSSNGIAILGNEDMDIPVRFGKCCSPVPGDEVVGYITRGRGVTVHKADCINMITGNPEDGRRVNVVWTGEESGPFQVAIQIIAFDRQRLLADLTAFVGDMGISITSVNAQVNNRKRTTEIHMSIEVKSISQMNNVLQQLQRKSDVIELHRT